MEDWISLRPTGHPADVVIRPPGDKSITHRGILLGIMAQGTSVVRGALSSEDINASIRIAEGFGARVVRQGDILTIDSPGLGRLSEPETVLDAANSGTTMRLATGIAATVKGTTVLTGDRSLRGRPMGRVLDPLRAMGVTALARQNRCAPLAIQGGSIKGGVIRIPVASAQVKSALLLAGLAAAEALTVVEAMPTRDHTERLLKAMRATVTIQDLAVTIEPARALQSFVLDVPKDPSSAAFWWALAAITGGRAVTEQVLLNPTRVGIVAVLESMGVTVTAQMTHRDPEPVGTVTVEGPGRLRAFSVEAPAVPSLIDELPVLAVLATQAYGTTRIQGAQELRVKESDRISAMGDGLRALGAQIEDREDGWIISGPALLRGTSVDSRGDHRVAMALAVAAAIAKGETRIAQAASVSISYPEFWTVMEQTGAIEIDRRGLYPV